MRLAIIFAWSLCAISPLTAAPPKDNTKGLELFEKKVRPVLVEHCYSCHSAEADAKRKLKASLFLDTREGLIKGGDSGPAIVPGKSQESLLIKVMRGEEASVMPPKGKLPDAVIADIAAWIDAGAPDPRHGAVVKARGMSLEDGRKFWAYKAFNPPAIPAVADVNWAKDHIDRFILARLEAAKLKPTADADRAVLVRRLYYDLIGLPPTPEQIDEFVNDRRPDALEQLVDRLLAMPEFGERFGRRWLDVVRYADSLTLRGFLLPSAWRYRDYVIDVFNRDIPFDRFIREQLAGDLLGSSTLDEKRRLLAAVQVLQLGNTNLEEQDKKALTMDVIDEQLDVITKAFLAQTVTCARCHDHKFDPIPTKDYYALAGILAGITTMKHANVSALTTVSLSESPEHEKELAAHEKKIADLQSQIKTLKAKSLTKASVKPAKGVIDPTTLPGIVVDDSQAKAVGNWTNSQFSGSYIGTGYRHDGNEGKGAKTLTFLPELQAAGQYEVWLAYSSGGSRAKNVPVTVLSVEGEKVITVDMTALPPIEGRFVSLGKFRFERGNQGYVLISNEDTKGHVTADAVIFLPLDQPANANTTGKGTTSSPVVSAGSDELRRLEADLEHLKKSGPRRETILAVQENKPVDLRIHIRGSGSNLGAVAPRGVMSVIGNAPQMPNDESGRRQLADWIASPSNPLTARVIVNRAWQWVFGVGLVRTPDNFGTTGEAPSHPELLDHLATRFIAEGWSMKKLIRTMVLSRTYRQASTAEPATLSHDPENRLLGRMNRRRLDAECIRDGMLAIAGSLDRRRGGPDFPTSLASDFGYKHESLRRSVYLPVFRNSIPEMLEVFDFADPSLVTGRRNVSTVAPQALFLLNHPFVNAQATATAQRLLAESASSPERIERAYRLILGRSPTPAELSKAAKFVGDSTKPTAWAVLMHALFASIEFRYVN